MTPAAESAVDEALRAGRAILKFISRNDVGDTGGHQCGYYLPKHSWEIFTDIPPEKGTTSTKDVRITWGNGQQTDSSLKWYGRGKSEYRLTKFGRGFSYLDKDNVGSLLVLIPHDFANYSAYVLDFDDDIEGVQTALGLEIVGTVAVFEKGVVLAETEDACVDRKFRSFISSMEAFPKARLLSDSTREAMIDCIRSFQSANPDRRLLRLVQEEYRLFRMLERKLAEPEVTRLFKDIEDFISVAQSLLQRRKGRAGLSFQNHFQDILTEEKIPHDAQPDIEGLPDFVIPSVEAYKDKSYPTDRLLILGLKTTCKDRWRQVLEEGPRVPRKHIVTLQQGISVSQLLKMKKSNVSLVVPKDYHNNYDVGASGIELLSVAQFISSTREKLY
jgi:hypothetical protein